MSLVEPAFQPSPPLNTFQQAPFGAVVARQLSVWPFGARTARLLLLVDPSLPSRSLRDGVLRAMQQGYFASDGYSQTRAVREAALAAHYVLRHHNRDLLPLNQVNAASAVAAVRGRLAFVALAGHAAAFAWRNGELSGQRGILRLPRPLGLEQDPAITLWRTPLSDPADRLVLVCGATWPAEAEREIHSILSSTSSTAEAEQQLADVLGGARPASVLVVAPGARTHLRLLSAHEPERHEALAEPPAPPPRVKHFSLHRWLAQGLGFLLLGLLTLALLAISPHTVLPADRVDGLSPRMAVRFGSSAANVVDMAVGDGALYTLDVVDGAVRDFSLDEVEQQPGPETLVARAGTSLSGTGQVLSEPVAIQFLPGRPGSLAIVDQSRAVVQLTEDGSLARRELASSMAWRELGALGSNPAGELLLLDSRAHQLLDYPVQDQAIVDPPRVVLDETGIAGLSFERFAQVVGTAGSVVARLDDGTVHRFGAGGVHQQLLLPAVNGRSTPISAIASDRSGGVFLADPLDARVVQTSLDGTLVRQLRSPALAGVRAIDVSLDGRRLYALVATGVLVADIPGL